MRETQLQDAFQAQVEAALPAGQRVVRWTANAEDDMDRLKRDPGAMDRPGRQRQVLLHSDPTKGIVGLIEGLLAVNRAAFEALRVQWTRKHATSAPSLQALAEAAAVKLASLWEAGCGTPEKTRSYRLLLAYGNAVAWQERSGVFGHDPRTLGPSDIDGWPAGLDPVSFGCAHAGEALPFLDLSIPEWVEQVRRGAAVQTATAAAQGVKQNAYAWVREFAVHTTNGREERADFTLFMHGLPVLWVEMKTPERGLAEAGGDFLVKETYLGAPLRLLADGQQAVLTSRAGGQLTKWFVGAGAIGHGAGMPAGNGKAPGKEGGQAYLVGQVLTRPERLEFLLRRASSFDPNGAFLIARPQQYQALAQWWRDLLWSAFAGQPIDNRLIRHTQRTGKTSTMIRAIRLALAARGQHGAAFDLAMLMVGEVLIIEQIAKALLEENTGLLDTALVVDAIQKRADLRRVMAKQKAQPDVQRVVLANTQKLDGKLALDELRSGSSAATPGGARSARALVVLDESHLAQTGDLADFRRFILPQATYLLLTATPKTEMASYYGISRPYHTLDDFGFQQALEAEMVVPVRFKRAASIRNGQNERIGQIARALDVNDDDLRQATAALDGIGGDDEEEDALVRPKVAQLLARLENDLIDERLDAIVDEMTRIRDALARDETTGEAVFHPRAIGFVRNVAGAKAIIDWIQDLNLRKLGPGLADHERNVYRGLRFGLDVANFGHGDDTLEKYNPGVINPKAIKARLESNDPDTRIDVLLAVGKYTKGYDNPHLCLVALLKTVREPSLINQIYTRPATRCDGKPSGVCLDLALGNGNVRSWQHSLDLYDQEQAELPLFDEAGVDALLSQARGHLGAAAAAVDPSWSVADLGQFHQLGSATDRLKEQGDAQAKHFVVSVERACAVIRRLPDAAVLGPLQNPLLGVKAMLGWVRPLFPHLWSEAGAAADDSATVDLLDTAAFGKLIDRALATLSSPSLKHFLDISVLGAQIIDGGDRGSQALAGARVHQEIQVAIGATKALLKAQEAAPKPKPHEARGDLPPLPLGLALEVALARLIEMEAEGQGGLSNAQKRAHTQQRLALIQEDIERQQKALPGDGFASLLLHYLRCEFEQGWEARGLPEADRSLFDPLVGVAAERWAQAFVDWRRRNGGALRIQDASAAASRWLRGLSAHEATLMHWYQETDAREGGRWMERVAAVARAHPDRVDALRAAMGEGDAAMDATPQERLLDRAVLAAAQQLAQIEANAAWMRTHHAA